ncbi:NAD(P)-dependent oxidoreductase [Occultella gossypii]|uniref:Phosphoglycerate dehydrogenase n=1 Tax=Occultella gossypii TaxID=2800820 RepID=A0ABS7SDW3_9MICO|nr:NAD(P)-dependent oxidoreductase [Occultella gossypii]MBZ2197934.1 phosphoglycerate dehydrogenase [Occultella gossypii]
MKLLMPTSVPDGLELDPDQSDVRVVSYDPEAPIPDEHRDAEVVVAWMNPRDKLVEIAGTLPSLRWVQALGSGPESFLTAGFAPEVAITRGIDLHNVPVAEHCVALLLAAARRLDLARDAQLQGRWATAVTGNQLVTRSGFTQIHGSRFVIWGLGRIGATVATYLQALGGSVRGIGRTSGVRDGIEISDVADAASVLADADALIAVLPDRENTVGVIDRRILEMMPADSWFVNVGRGRTVVEADLIGVLEEGAIAGAALDVFATEPLPEDSPLWGLPNVILTPHSAGGRPYGTSGLINENLRRYRSGQPLLGLLH